VLRDPSFAHGAYFDVLIFRCPPPPAHDDRDRSSRYRNARDKEPHAKDVGGLTAHE
jgi:hypothetical protein